MSSFALEDVEFMIKVASSLFCCVCIVLLIPSCSSKRAHAGNVIFYNPVEYNDFIVDHQNATIRNMVKLSDAFDNGTEQEVILQYRALVSRSDSSLAMLKQLSDYEGDSLLRNSAIDLLQFYNNVFHNEYKEMIDIFLKGDSASDADISNLNQIVEKVRTQEENLNQKLSVAQEKFATKFQFEFEGIKQ